MSEKQFMPPVGQPPLQGRVTAVFRAPGDFADLGDPVMTVQLAAPCQWQFITICSPEKGKVMRSRNVGDVVNAGDRLIEVASVGAPSYEIFVAYRQADTAALTGRLTDALCMRFGSGQVFRDRNVLGGGDRFREVVLGHAERAHVMVVVVGPGWSADARLADANDLHRNEIAIAIRRNIHIVPVLVGNTTLPRPEELPEELRPLLERQFELLSEARWTFDVTQVVANVERRMADSPVRARFLQQIPPEGSGWQWITDPETDPRCGD